jgi:hypothetical protein
MHRLRPLRDQMPYEGHPHHNGRILQKRRSEGQTWNLAEKSRKTLKKSLNQAIIKYAAFVFSAKAAYFAFFVI